MERVIDCKECEHLIPDFLNQILDYKTLKKFKEHINDCPDCKEELAIQYLVIEGMPRLEEGSALDLQGELDKRMNEAERKVKFHNSFVFLGFIVEMIGIFAILGFVLWIII